MKGRKTVVFIDTKEIILNSFQKLLEKQSFEKMTIQDILDEAHISRATFYKHFRNKYDLPMAIVSQYLTQEFLLQYRSENYPKTTLYMYAYISSNQKYFKRIFKETGEDSFYHALVKYYESSYISHAKERFFTEHLTDEQLFKINVASNQLAYCIKKWVDMDCRPAPAEFSEWMRKIVIDIADILEG